MSSVQPTGESPQYTFTLGEDKKKGRLVLKKGKEEVGSIAINIVKSQPGFSFFSEIQKNILNLFGKKFVQRIDSSTDTKRTDEKSTDNKKITYVNVKSILKLAKQLGLGEGKTKEFKQDILKSTKTGDFSKIEMRLIQLAQIREIKKSEPVADSNLKGVLSELYSEQNQGCQEVTIYEYVHGMTSTYSSENSPENISSQEFFVPKAYEIRGTMYKEKDENGKSGDIYYFKRNTTTEITNMAMTTTKVTQKSDAEKKKIEADEEEKIKKEMKKSERSFVQSIFRKQKSVVEAGTLFDVLADLKLEPNKLSEVTIYRQDREGTPHYFAYQHQASKDIPINTIIAHVYREGRFDKYYLQELDPATGKPR